MSSNFLNKTGLSYFYSKIKEMLQTKQDKLYAGDNITIGTDNRIEAYNKVYVGTCATSESEEVKEISCPEWILAGGNVIIVNFLNGNTTIHVTASDKTNWNGKADKATTLAGYNIQDAMTAEEITHAINDAIGSVTGISFEVVSELPSTGESGKIYLVPHEHGAQDAYDEYIYYNNAWEKIGSTDIDLSNYWSMDNLVAITNEEIDNIVAQ